MVRATLRLPLEDFQKSVWLNWSKGISDRCPNVGHPCSDTEIRLLQIDSQDRRIIPKPPMLQLIPKGSLRGQVININETMCCPGCVKGGNRVAIISTARIVDDP
jgi:hypothetical protein